ncbi:uncharacterized protein DSM5745_00708 [Aspergillus mulundensis]|uniref:Uncharacterized protein n=1 Tax=Aspergillus mulundensis TaxID=1810919 RepID=A0A3D8T4A3_9EURO|nr:hypothetical protein DSM5745_00708 [Aspergillus mulundensis]RDW93386.1 hypothetical protein DSM5745_00708 [Aspergillus mulundensis]
MGPKPRRRSKAKKPPAANLPTPAPALLLGPHSSAGDEKSRTDPGNEDVNCAERLGGPSDRASDSGEARVTAQLHGLSLSSAATRGSYPRLTARGNERATGVGEGVIWNKAEDNGDGDDDDGTHE